MEHHSSEHRVQLTALRDPLLHRLHAVGGLDGQAVLDLLEGLGAGTHVDPGSQHRGYALPQGLHAQEVGCEVQSRQLMQVQLAEDVVHLGSH